MEVLNTIHLSLFNLKSETGEKWVSLKPSAHNVQEYRVYSDEAMELWTDFKIIATEMLEKGNPLNKG